MLLHQTPEVQKFLWPPGHMSSSSLSNSTHILYGIAFCDLSVSYNQNLCNSKSSLLHDTSPSFSPLSSVSISLVFSSGTIWAILALGCCNLLTFFCCLHNNIKTTRLQYSIELYLFFLRTQTLSRRKSFPTLIPLWCSKTAYFHNSWICRLWAHDLTK